MLEISSLLGTIIEGEEGFCGGEESDRNSTGNRWLRHETVALLKIRSEMDVAFRESTFKGALWEDVSRKLAELGYQRTGKKCKEKFENVYKYHKRTREGKPARQDGKTYRFSNQLQALNNPLLSTSSHETVHTPEIPTNPTNIFQNPVPSLQNPSVDFIPSSFTFKKKKKMVCFFDSLMKEVIQKQEMLQQRFMEVIEKREHERKAREDEWKIQEQARLDHQHEILAKERSMAAARDNAVINLLRKITEKENPSEKFIKNPDSDSGNFSSGCSSRWPKAEVQALIRLRSSLNFEYHEIGPKGPLWEEISEAMSKLGYDRSSKRCKEKWENINKYFKKVKQSNKKRPQDSKTCPYFHQLDALYKEKKKKKKIDCFLNQSSVTETEELAVQMINEREQQHEKEQFQSVMEDFEAENVQQSQEDDDEIGKKGEDEIVGNTPSMAIIQ
ncbi:trihelix transcription factor DF1-like [Tasmannia lanceolata]|uniref:trihelix transcription factor DF1-like n=1 Tax=Tasmannia lanceolata TaxID=3420 RepID=UPI0040631445